MGLLLLAACSKSTALPGPVKEPVPVLKNVQFSVYADPERRSSRPVHSNAGIRLSIVQSRPGSTRPVAVWDTLIPSRQLADYPAPNAPLLIEKTISLQTASNAFYHLKAYRIYRISQQIVVDEVSRGITGGHPFFSMDIGL